MLKNLSHKALLVVIDGYGVNKNSTKNAVKDAHSPNIDQLFAHYPYTTLEAGGEKVGLPQGVAGNSEVGHMNLGAGRSIRQDLVRINEVIENKTLEQMEKLEELIATAKSKTKRIHLMGLFSDGGVHSHINHLEEVLKIFAKDDQLEVFFHAFMDGRDTAPDVGEKYIKLWNGFKGRAQFASMQGRSWGMDRDRRWEKIQLCYDMMTGAGPISSLSPSEYLKSEYEQGRQDEFLMPTLFNKDFAMSEGDCVFFLNFRPDRAVQISLAFNDPNFHEFKRKFIPPYFLCMTPYIPDEVKLPILFDKEKVPGGLSQYLSEIGKKQFKIAETEKYAHVTFFFNGGEKTPFPGEQQKLIPSPKEVKTYNLKPEMSAFTVCEQLLLALEEDFDFYLVNFANCDMVGHTGDYAASLKAVEAVDKCIGELSEFCLKNNIAMMITADHGNCDQMVYEDGSPHTSHTGVPVPFALVHPQLKDKKLTSLDGGALMDVAPTILAILGIEYPPTFKGHAIFS